MKHVVFFIISLAALTVGGFFVVKTLHHGSIRSLDNPVRVAVDDNLVRFSQDALYPDTVSAELFSAEGLERAHPGLLPVGDHDEVLRSEKNTSHGWVVRSGEDKDIRLARIYWSGSEGWQSGWSYLDAYDVVVNDVLYSFNPRLHTGKSFDMRLEEKRVSILADELGKTEEVLFSEEGIFYKLFPGLGRVISPTQISGTQYDFSRGWVIGGGEEGTLLARVYWNNTFYWISDWQGLGAEDLVKAGIPLSSFEASGDFSPGENEKYGGIIFGRDAFGAVFPDLKKLVMPDSLTADENYSRGWILHDDEEETQIARVYWNDTHYWMSDWQDFERGVIANETFYRLGEESAPVAFGSEKNEGDDGFREKLNAELMAGRGAEVMFGANAFGVLFPGLKKSETLERVSSPVNEFSRGWVVSGKGGNIKIARIYWWDNGYWISGTENLENGSFVEKGVLYAPEKGWDASRGNNWAVILGIMFGLLLGAVILFFFLEAVFVELY